jgi:hypothetical protein
MAANTGERTLTPALIPPGPAHINGVHTIGAGHVDHVELVLAAASMASLLGDCGVRTTPKSEILFSVVQRLPVALDERVRDWILLRTLRLNCVTEAYAPLWAGCYRPDFRLDRWTSDDLGREAVLSDVYESWSPRTPLRRAVDRRRASVELDALVAIALDISVEELCSVYRTQFPVLAGYDRRHYAFDSNGRLVPSSTLASTRRAGPRGVAVEDRTAVHPGSKVSYVHEPPFRFLDREADMKSAYVEFERRLSHRSAKTA